MAWRQRLRTASFRKIRFNLTDTNQTFGRRTVTHEFPNRDTPYEEDLGRKQRQFTIEAFIVGLDYLRQKDRLIKACETEGPGRLVHPFYGNRDVVCTSIQVREGVAEGGVARFTMSFREAGKLSFPSRGRSARGIFALLGLASVDQAISDFTDNFSVAKYPQAVVDGAQEGVTDFAEALDNSTAFITRNADEISDLAFSVSDLLDDVENIIHTPEILAARITNSIGLLRSSVTDRRLSFGANQKLFTFGADDTFGNFNSIVQQALQRNKASLNNLIRATAMAEAAKDAVEIEFDSVEDAELYRADLFEVIESLQIDPYISNKQYGNLYQYKADLVKSVPEPGRDLPSIREYTPSSTTNSLAIAYELYGELSLDQDIVDRNRISNPALIMGGVPIEVISA
jgi:prophage DNA circulation protein